MQLSFTCIYQNKRSTPWKRSFSLSLISKLYISTCEFTIFLWKLSQVFFYQKLVKSHADDVHGIPLFLALTGHLRFFFVTPSII